MSKFYVKPLDEIFVDSDRIRKDFGDISGLVASIRENGVLQPIVINEQGKIIAGERRWRASSLAGLTAIPVHEIDNLPTEKERLIEFIENDHREAFTWQEDCQAIYAYHQAAQQAVEDWKEKDTANALKISISTVNVKINLCEASVEYPQVWKFETLAAARNFLTRQSKRAGISVLDDMSDLTRELQPQISSEVSVPEISVESLANTPAPTSTSQVQDTTIQAKPATPAVLIPILNKDFSLWVKETKVRNINFIHCDFPYGIDFHKHKASVTKGHEAYSDSLDVYEQLLDTLEKACEIGIVAQDAHMLFWFSPHHYEFTKQRLTEMGWHVYPFPLIWGKSDMSGVIPDARYEGRRIYEMAFQCMRGDRNISVPVANLHWSPMPQKKHHPSEKGLEMLKHFFKMFVDKSTIMLDPTCGSANSLIAATSLGAKFTLGLEIDPDAYTAALENWKSSDASNEGGA